MTRKGKMKFENTRKVQFSRDSKHDIIVFNEVNGLDFLFVSFNKGWTSIRACVTNHDDISFFYSIR